jgi:hypothetical protein
MSANVYYLAPPATVVERPGRLSPGLKLRLRLLAFWCRLQLTAAEVAGALRRFGRAESDADPVILEEQADLILAVRPAPSRPAPIIDFVAARARLRS